jgi:rhodanese-related sulfurtransferase
MSSTARRLDTSELEDRSPAVDRSWAGVPLGRYGRLDGQGEAMGSASERAAGPSTSVEQLLADARARLNRLTPEQAHAAMRAGALMVDIRSDSQRARDGLIPGARFVPRNVLEWRLDPACPHRDSELGRPDAQIVLLCDEGYQSSLAAATVRSFGVSAATDVVGGFRAWRAAGLPVEL